MSTMYSQLLEKPKRKGSRYETIKTIWNQKTKPNSLKIRNSKNYIQGEKEKKNSHAKFDESEPRYKCIRHT